MKTIEPSIAESRLNLSMSEVKRLTCFDHNRVYKLINSGALRTYTVGRRRYATFEAVTECLRNLEKRGANP